MASTDIIKGRTRRVGIGTRSVVQAGSIVQILPTNPARVAIIITCESNGCHIWADPAGNIAYGRIIQLASYPPLILDVETFGSLVTGWIWADATTTPCAINILSIVDTTYDGSRGYAGVE
jgi:hypothetical protein